MTSQDEHDQQQQEQQQHDQPQQQHDQQQQQHDHEKQQNIFEPVSQDRRQNIRDKLIAKQRALAGTDTGADTGTILNTASASITSPDHFASNQNPMPEPQPLIPSPPATAPIREDLVSQAVQFLDKVRDAPMSRKLDFLRTKKGLTEAEIELAQKRVVVVGEASSSVSGAALQPSSSSASVLPSQPSSSSTLVHQPHPIPPPPLPSSKMMMAHGYPSDMQQGGFSPTRSIVPYPGQYHDVQKRKHNWKNVALALIMVGGCSFLMVSLVQRYLTASYLRFRGSYSKGLTKLQNKILQFVRETLSFGEKFKSKAATVLVNNDDAVALPVVSSTPDMAEAQNVEKAETAAAVVLDFEDKLSTSMDSTSLPPPSSTISASLDIKDDNNKDGALVASLHAWSSSVQSSLSMSLAILKSYRDKLEASLSLPGEGDEIGGVGGGGDWALTRSDGRGGGSTFRYTPIEDLRASVSELNSNVSREAYQPRYQQFSSYGGYSIDTASAPAVASGSQALFYKQMNDTKAEVRSIKGILLSKHSFPSFMDPK